jgi:DNA end-binding protein Ku
MGTTKATPRASSNLTVGFGLVNVPIALKPIADSGRPISGKYVCPEHGPNIAQRYLCSEGTKQEHLLAAGGQQTAYEHPDEKGKFVVVEPDVLSSIAEERSGRIEVERFVSVTEIDPIYFDKSYLCWPQGGAEAAFDLFAEVLHSEKKAAVATVVMSKQTVTLVIRWSEITGTLVAHTCRFEAQIRWSDAELVKNAASGRGDPIDTHLKAARTLVASMDGQFEPGEVVDRYTPMLQDAVRAAASGKTFETPAPETPAVEKTDLLESLMASVAGQKKPAAKKPAAKPRKPRAKQPA